MRSAWRSGGSKGEGHGVPVELRFVDMFMAAIGALIFMAMTLAIVMRDAGKEDAAGRQLRVYASLKESESGSETKEPLSSLFGFQLILTRPGSATAFTNCTFGERDLVIPSPAPPELLAVGNTGIKTNLYHPFLLVLDNRPTNGTYQLQVEVYPIRAGNNANYGRLQNLTLHVSVELATAKATNDLIRIPDRIQTFAEWLNAYDPNGNTRTNVYSFNVHR